MLCTKLEQFGDFASSNTEKTPNSFKCEHCARTFIYAAVLASRDKRELDTSVSNQWRSDCVRSTLTCVGTPNMEHKFKPKSIKYA
jgi:hypothetical protein